MTPFLKKWITETKETPPYEVKKTQLYPNTVFLSLSDERLPV